MKLRLETGEVLHFAPGQKLQVEFPLNPFTFKAIELPRAYSFNLPASPENIAALELAHLPAVSTARSFKGFDSRLQVLGTELRGKLNLNKAARKSYDAQFAAVLPELGEFAERKIADILKDLVHEFADTDFAHLNTYLTAPDVPIHFPEMKIGNRIHNEFRNGAYHKPEQVDDPAPVPIVNLLYVFEKCVEAIGWRVRNPDWHTAYPDIAKIELCNRRPLPLQYDVSVETVDLSDPESGQGGLRTDVTTLNNVTLPESIRIADFLPDWTFGQLLNTLRGMFGLVITPDSKFRALDIRFADDTFSETAEDWTDSAEDAQEVEPYPFNGLRFKWAKDSADERLKNLPENAPESFEEAQAISELTATAEGAIGLVRSQNRYYTRNRLPNGDLEWQPGAFALSAYQTTPPGKKDVTEIAADAMPQQTTSLLLFDGRGGKIINNGGGKVRLAHVNTVQLRPALITLKNARNHPNSLPALVGQEANFYADLSMNFVQEEDNIEWTRQVAHRRALPDHQGGLIVADESGNVPTQAPRLVFWHGLTEGLFGEEYPYASFSNYNLKREKLAAFSLRWEGEEGLAATFYGRISKALTDARQVTQNFRLPADRIAKLRPGLRIRVRETVYVALSATVDFAEGDSHPLAKMRLLRTTQQGLGEAECTNTIVLEQFLDCEPEPQPEDPTLPPDVTNPRKRMASFEFWTGCLPQQTASFEFFTDCDDGGGTDPDPDPTKVTATFEFYRDCWPQQTATVQFFTDCSPTFTITIAEAC